jgi:hypothetical protein
MSREVDGEAEGWPGAASRGGLCCPGYGEQRMVELSFGWVYLLTISREVIFSCSVGGVPPWLLKYTFYVLQIR